MSRPSNPVLREWFAPETIDRFEGLFIPEPNSGCWLWNGNEFYAGYGFFYVPTSRGRPMRLKAHRASFAIYRSDVPRDLYVCHKCDVRSCVNPDHLWLGTHADNIADRDKKGRAARGDKSGPRTKPWAFDYRQISGERHYAAKLTAEQVRMIRSTKESSRVLGRLLGVHHSYIRQVRSGKKWRRLDGTA